jgi:hypothetical protein
VIQGMAFAGTTSQAVVANGFPSGSVRSELFFNPAIPSDLTVAFALAGIGIGSGQFSFSGGGVSAGATFRIDTVSVNGAVVPTPLPAALPLFAAGLGITGVLGWRRKRKGSPPSITANSLQSHA